MLFKQLAPQLAGITAVLATPLNLRRNEHSSYGTIEWGPCAFNGTLPILCGKLAVPVDYSDSSSSKTVDLNLVKVPAIISPSRGTIQLNFGGPGLEAIHTLANLAGELQRKTGGYHDLIAFDPRGTGDALKYSCFDTPLERMIATYQYPTPLADASDVAPGQLWATASVLSTICHEKTQEVAELIGTAYVARDLMQVVDALGEDGLLRYWGLSYGTVVGETVAAMFPGRMDKILMDGVVNGYNYYHRTGIDVDQLLSADAAFLEALSQCIEAEDLCPLSTVNSTALELQTTLWDLAEQIRLSPIAVDTVIIDYSVVVNIYYLSIKYPAVFPLTAQLILDILTRQNLDDVVGNYTLIYGSLAAGNPESIYGILGGDKFPRYSSLVDVLPDIEYAAQTSPRFWGLIAPFSMLTAQWPFVAKERYDGDFKVKTKNPMLFVGNTWDPATPIASARNMSATFEGSVLFEQHGIGHSTLAQASACTAKVISDYFVDGILPAPDTLCEVDKTLFT